MNEFDASASRLLLAPSVIEGIGERYGAALSKAGIRSLADLLRRPAGRIAAAVPPISATTAERWRSAAHLLQVSGVDPDVAEALVDAGIGSVAALSSASLRTLEEAVVKAHGARKIARAPDLYALAAIQRHAAEAQEAGMVVAELRARGTDAALAGVTVRCAGKKAVTDAEGRFVLSEIPAGAQRLEIELDGRRRVGASIPIRKRQISRLSKIRIDASPRTARTFREGSRKAILFAAGCRMERVRTSLSDLPDPTHLVVRKVLDSGQARLVHLYRSKTGRTIHIEFVDVESSELPRGARIGDVLELRGGVLSATELDVKDVQKLKVQGIVRGDLRELTRRTVRVPSR